MERIEVISHRAPVTGLLPKAAQENAKKWKFRKSNEVQEDPRGVTLIYVFKLSGVCEGCCYEHFSFDFPNRITVVGKAWPLTTSLRGSP